MTARVGIVLVSHSTALAEAALTLALEMVAGDPPQIVLAAGTADGNPSGHHRLGAEGPLDADDPIVTMVGIAV